jgi:hypothetical protein
MLKKELILIALLGCLFNSNAQVKNHIKLDIETGFLLFSASENLGAFFHVEPKLKIAKNTSMGLRVGIVFNPQKYRNHNILEFEIGDEYDNGGMSLVPTIEYSFKESNIRGKFFRPYLGLGVGVHVSSYYVDIVSLTTMDQLEVKVRQQVGALFRAGLTSNRLRIGVQYNLVKKATIEMPNGQLVGTVDNSYFGLSIGYIFGSEVALN